MKSLFNTSWIQNSALVVLLLIGPKNFEICIITHLFLPFCLHYRNALLLFERHLHVGITKKITGSVTGRRARDREKERVLTSSRKNFGI